MQSFTLTLGLFNHTKQLTLSVDVESCDFTDWLESQTDEMTLECLEVDSQAFPTIKCFDDLSTLIAWLDGQSYVNLDQVSDFLDLFNLSDLDSYDDYHTGCDDFSSYAQDMADEMLCCNENSDFARQYFDYDAFEHDLSFDCAIGRYVWRNF